MKNFLFITPYAGRTGSEMFLWYMFSQFDRNKLKASLVSECDGALLNQMPEDVQTFITLKYPDRATRIKQILTRPLKKNLYEEHLLKIHNRIKPDYWYLNTILMTNKVSLAQKHNIPVVMHFHELTSDYGLVSKKQLQETIDYASLCIADSKAVYDKLKMLGAKNIALQYECVDCSKIVADDKKTASIRASLGLAKFNFVWLMSGTSILRKGIDMVPELAKHLKLQNAALVWLGNNSSSGMDLMIEKELAYNNVDNVFFLGKKSEDYYSYMNVMDGFVLTSREEPFGMVIVEAMKLGKPVVAFDAGGVAEILTPQTGRIVHSWNVADLAAMMKDVANNRKAFDKEASVKRAMDFDASLQVKNWENILSTL